MTVSCIFEKNMYLGILGYSVPCCSSFLCSFWFSVCLFYQLKRRVEISTLIVDMSLFLILVLLVFALYINFDMLLLGAYTFRIFCLLEN